MRRLVQCFTDGLLAAAIAILAVAFHISLSSALKAHARGRLAVQHYRPVYTHSGRRKRDRF